MRSSITFAILIVLGLVGCASQQVRDIEAWSRPALIEAKAGNLKWTDYYKQLFDRISSAPDFASKGQLMSVASEMITFATAFEQGIINKEVFELAQRNAQVKQQTIADGQSAQSRAALAAAMNSVSNSYKQSADMYQQRALQTPVQPYKAPVTCTTQYIGGQYQTVCR